MKMGYRYGQHTPSTEDVNDAVGEAISLAASNLATDLGPGLWKIHDPLDGPLNFLVELVAQPVALSVIVRDGFVKFFPGSIVKNDGHGFFRARRVANTSSAGTPLTLPSSNS